VYKRICQPDDEDGATTAPVHLLTGHVRLLPLPLPFAKLKVTSLTVLWSAVMLQSGAWQREPFEIISAVGNHPV